MRTGVLWLTIILLMLVMVGTTGATAVEYVRTIIG